MGGFAELKRQVVDCGLCTSCGTCIGVCPRGNLVFDDELEEPKRVADCSVKCNICLLSCPGKDIPKRDLDLHVFGRERDLGSEMLGITRSLARGYVTNDAIRQAGAAGGCVSGLLAYALEKGIIDAAVVLGMDTGRPWRVRPVLAQSVDDIISCAQSKYSVAPTNTILSEILRRDLQKVAVVGCPCHIHGIRKMQINKSHPKLTSRIVLTLGLFCGTNWTYRAWEHVLTEMCGLNLDDVAALGFREGPYPGMFTAVLKDGSKVTVPTNERRPFTMLFLRDRCSMCYDYANEFADLSFGDFPDPALKRGDDGWSAIIVRTARGENLLRAAEADGYLVSEKVSQEYFLGSNGFEMKMHGCGYRLSERRRHGWPVPDYQYPIYPVIPMPRKIFTKHPHFSGE